jgi:hypothetical protein
MPRAMPVSRRSFLARSALAGAAASLPAAARAKGGRPAPAPLSWLGGAAPALAAGVAWGAPWPRGAVARGTPVAVRDGAGRLLPTQGRPLAYWPDGAVKWTGAATR